MPHRTLILPTPTAVTLTAIGPVVIHPPLWSAFYAITSGTASEQGQFQALLAVLVRDADDGEPIFTVEEWDRYLGAYPAERKQLIKLVVVVTGAGDDEDAPKN